MLFDRKIRRRSEPIGANSAASLINCAMSIVFVGLLLVGICVQTLTQGGDAVLASLTAGATDAVTLCLSLLGAYLFWMGLMGILREAGLMELLSRSLRPFLRFLFPNAGDADGPIAMNLAANMLGMGNAATPYGLEAMQRLQSRNPHPAVATNEMCVLLAVNASCLELFPATLIALRQSYQSTAPASVVLPTLLSSLLATVAAIVLCRWCCRRSL